MSSTATQSPAELQEQFLDGLRQNQQVVIKTVQAWTRLAEAYAPGPVAAPEYPAASELAAQQFDFAEKLVANQREFVEELLASAPAAPGRSSTKAAAK
jgi:hypothetical protein